MNAFGNYNIVLTNDLYTKNEIIVLTNDLNNEDDNNSDISKENNFFSFINKKRKRHHSKTKYKIYKSPSCASSSLSNILAYSWKK